jgi:hypothetical protein
MMESPGTSWITMKHITAPVGIIIPEVDTLETEFATKTKEFQRHMQQFRHDKMLCCFLGWNWINHDGFMDVKSVLGHLTRASKPEKVEMLCTFRDLPLYQDLSFIHSKI